jgi:hypothetical protein
VNKGIKKGGSIYSPALLEVALIAGYSDHKQ